MTNKQAREILHKLESRGSIENCLTMEQIYAIRVAQGALDDSANGLKMTEVFCDCDYCMNNHEGKCELESIEIDGAAECKHYSENDYGRADNG